MLKGSNLQIDKKERWILSESCYALDTHDKQKKYAYTSSLI